MEGAGHWPAALLVAGDGSRMAGVVGSESRGSGRRRREKEKLAGGKVAMTRW